MDGLRAGARQALLDAIRASTLLALVDEGGLPASRRKRLEVERQEAMEVLVAYRNVGIDLWDLHVEAALIRKYLGELDAR